MYILSGAMLVQVQLGVIEWGAYCSISYNGHFVQMGLQAARISYDPEGVFSKASSKAET